MNKALGHNVVAKLAPTFTKATAAKTGISERSIERDVARGSQTRLGDIKGTSLAKGIELDALAKLEKIDPAKRDTIIDLAKAGKKVSATTEIADAGIHNKPTVTGPPIWTTVDGAPGHSWLIDEIAAGEDHLVYAAQIMLNLKPRMSESERNKASNAFLDIATRASRCAAIIKPEGNSPK